MDKFLAGATITLKAVIQQPSPDPFGTLQNADPDNGVKITFEHKASAYEAVSALPMSKSSTGKYFYVWQTTQAERIGKWNVRIDVDGAVYDTVRELEFMLNKPVVTI